MSLKSTIEKLPFYNNLVLPLHWVRAVAAAEKYHFPAKKLRIIAVTGTNGKTTTSFMIWKMLNHAGHKTGLLTTVAWGGVGEKPNNPSNLHNPSHFDEVRGRTEQRTEPHLTCGEGAVAGSDDVIREEEGFLPLQNQLEHMTTEKVSILNQRIRTIADSGAEFLVLETTSHALSQFRTLGIPIEIAVFTNLTHEHLDYHKTFANYRKAKLKLFRHAKYGVVNADDPNAEYFTKIYSPHDISTYGINQGDYQATDITLSQTGVEYSCGDIKIHTQIPGKFNVYNSLAALAVGKRLGLTDQQISQGIATLASVEGRMNRIDEGQNFDIIIDYAHTPDALEKVFTSVISNEKPTSKKSPKIISVHGGAGRRDESTRFIRGEILGKYSDIVIITEDDSRDEDPAKIASEFTKGAQKAGKILDKNLFVNLDRKSAIQQALKLAKKGDLVLILGKGHEKTILRADGPHDFEDIKITRKLLQTLSKTKL